MEEDKQKPKMLIPEAKGLCNDCIEKKCEILDDDLATCYCPHNLTGGIYQADLGIWRLSTPVLPDYFQQLAKMTISGIRQGREELLRKSRTAPRKFS